ncbi:Amino acid permease 8 [Hibiscus syriacus]|uniref:Amino acid permease 8 n=1 Tax=Hibiscus syriacus TaxID=106335 RepID=A0A6A3CR70_HIBSY|nr:Amino acid permease 8 [Hibiscus syriacus]
MELETGKPTIASYDDDDVRSKRTGKPFSNLGTWVSASAHIITAVIGSGVLSLSWRIAQLGWIAGPIALVVFSVITWFTSNLLADCCRDPVSGTRFNCYMDAVKSNLGGINNKFCGIAQYVNLVGVTIGYSITSAISMAAIKRSGCFHKEGHAVGCHVKNNMFIIIFGIIEITLSQIPNFHELSWLSVVAVVMSFAYSCIGVGLSIARVVGGSRSRTSLTGTTIRVDVTDWEKVWNAFEALGDIAFAYGFSNVLVEIQASLLVSMILFPFQGKKTNTIHGIAGYSCCGIRVNFYQ